MNPEYKEITYHQLMKKIEVLNELNLEEGILGDIGQKFSKRAPGLFGNSYARNKQRTDIDAATIAADASDEAEKNNTNAQNQTNTANDSLINTANAAADKIENDKRPEFIRSKEADEDFRARPTPENEAKAKAARGALRITPLTKNTPKTITPLKTPTLADREKIKKDYPELEQKSGYLGNKWKAYIASAKYRMQQSPGIGSFMNAPGKKEDLPDNQKDNDRNKKMSPQDCLQLKRDTIPGRWLAVRGRYGCTNP